jgi:hypothetical protein
LRQHIQWAARVVGGLDVGREHSLGDDRRLEEVATPLRHDLPHAWLSDVVASSADAL